MSTFHILSRRHAHSRLLRRLHARVMPQPRSPISPLQDRASSRSQANQLRLKTSDRCNASTSPQECTRGPGQRISEGVAVQHVRGKGKSVYIVWVYAARSVEAQPFASLECKPRLPGTVAPIAMGIRPGGGCQAGCAKTRKGQELAKLFVVGFVVQLVVFRSV